MPVSSRGVFTRLQGLWLLLGLGLCLGLSAPCESRADEQEDVVEVEASAPAPIPHLWEFDAEAAQDSPNAEGGSEQESQATAAAASSLDNPLSWADEAGFAVPIPPGRQEFIQAALRFATENLDVSAEQGRQALQRQLAQLRLDKDLAPPAWGRAPSRNKWPSGREAEWLSKYYLNLPPLDGTYSVYGEEQAKEYADAEYALTNQIRVGKGLNALRRDPHLDAIAQAHAVHMAQTGFFDHANPYGMQVFERMGAADCPRWSSAGENIAAGQRSPDEVHRTWMKSKGHKHNILNKSYESIGIGAVYAPNTEYGWYWVQVFATFDRDSDQHDWIEPGESQ